ncbi:hypothetical protein [Virgibacillus kimchii]
MDEFEIPAQDVDRMINKGLGAGFIMYAYDLGKCKPLPLPDKDDDKEEGREKH